MKEKSLRFSVIIPCYNAAATIERALDSLVGEDFVSWEVICIDDCSKDNTIEVIERYKKQHENNNIQLIRSKVNGGPGTSRNKGLAVAKGEYLCFLDADDYYDLSMFSVLDEIISKTKADIVFYGCNQIIGNTVRKRPVTPRNGIMDYMALIGGSFWGGAWRHSLWQNIVIPSISNAEDIAVIPVLISRAKRIVAIDDLLYNYVHSNSSVSSRHHPQVSYNFVTSFQFTLQNVDINKFHDSIEFHGIKTIIYGATLNALKAGMSRKEIIELWVEFEQTFPNWADNKYIVSYSRLKRYFVKLASKRYFLMMRGFAWLHNKLLKTIG